jgi:tetratricopeptide (TPR) repeat protein
MGFQDIPSSTAPWLRELASHVDYAYFRRVWHHAVTEQAEQGFIAACYENVAKRANSEGEYYLAHDSANHGLRCAAAADFPPHRLIAAKSTALARSGAACEAQRVLDEFLTKHEADGSVCSAQARLLRDRGLALGPGNERSRLMTEASQWAAQAKDFARQEGGDWSYPANQEVQFLYFAGQLDTARTKALMVIEYIEQRVDRGSMWNQINLAEMRLVLGELDTAGDHYAKAAVLGIQSPGDLAANRAVAKLLLEEMSGDLSLLERWFPKPVLLIFAGHIPDCAARETPRLPEKACRQDGPAALAIRQQIVDMGVVEGISAGAPGGDILFAEALLATGGRITLIEPFPSHRIRTVAEKYGYDWYARLQRIYEKAAHIQAITCAEDVDVDTQCDYANHVMLGTALLRAKHINGQLRAIVLWDEADAAAPKPGGTGHFVKLCRESHIPIVIINPNTLTA